MAKKVRIVIPGDFPPQLQGSPHLEWLRQAGEVIMYTDHPQTAEEKIRRAAGATCLINSRSSLHWEGPVLRQLPELRMISVCGIGTDAINLQVAKEQGIVVCNIPNKTAAIVAEHALALLFAVSRRAWFQTDAIKRGRWLGLDNFSLNGKTLGVVGTGNIGAEMIRLGRAIGMKVVAWTFRPTAERARKLGVTFVKLDELLRSSDAISLHVKLTEQSRGLIGERELGLMKPGALLVNTARGAVVDTKALVAALHSGRLGGAGIDVFDVEPIVPDNPLLACEQVVLTPHNADQTPEGIDLLNLGVVENVLAFLEDRPQNRVI